MSCQAASAPPDETWVSACTDAPAPLELCQDVQTAVAAQDSTACSTLTEPQACGELMRITDDQAQGACTWCFTEAPRSNDQPGPFLPNPKEDGSCLPQPHGWYDVGSCGTYNVECGWRTRRPTTQQLPDTLPRPVPSTGAGSCHDCLRQSTGPHHWDLDQQTCGNCTPGDTCLQPCADGSQPSEGACPGQSPIATCPPVSELNVKGDYSFQCRYGDDTFVDYADKDWGGAAQGPQNATHWDSCAAVLISGANSSNQVSISFPCRPGQSTEEVTVEQITDCNQRLDQEACTKGGQCDWTSHRGAHVCLPASLQRAQCQYGAGSSDSGTTHNGLVRNVIELDLNEHDAEGKVKVKQVNVWGAYRCPDGEEPVVVPDSSLAVSQLSCTKCAAGSFGLQGKCYQCDPGTANQEPGYAPGGKQRCPPCPAGTFADKRGQSTCAPCPINEYQPEEGQTSCQPVPAGHVATATTPSPLQDTVCSRWNDAKRGWSTNSSTYVKNANFLGQGNPPFDQIQNECTEQTSTCTSSPSSVCSGSPGNCHFQLGRPSVLVTVEKAFTLEQQYRAAGPEAGTVLGLCNAEPYRILPDGSSAYGQTYWAGTAKPTDVTSIGTRWVNNQPSSDYVSREQASVACQAQGKRLCTQAEVTAAAQRGGADGSPRSSGEQCHPGYTSDARGLFMTEAHKGCWDQAGWIVTSPASGAGAWCCPAYDFEMSCMESEGQCTSKPLANYDFKIVPRSAAGGATATALCPEGTYAVESNGTYGNQCAPCPVGHKCTGGISTACSAGTYQDKTGQTSCQPCAAGTYQDQEGQAACKKCGGPQYYCTAEASTRTEVDDGYYSTGGDPTTRTGQAKCGGAYYYCTGGEKKTVDHGYYSTGGDPTTRTGQAKCGGPQYFCLSGDQMIVDTGHYSTPADGPPDLRTGQSPCANNQYCTNGVATTCKAGTEPGNQTCNECHPGWYSPDGSPCQTCQNGWHYQPSFGQAACKACPPGSTANQAKTACCPFSCSGSNFKDGQDCHAYGWLCNSYEGNVCKKVCGCPATRSGGTCSKDEGRFKKGMSCSYVSDYTGDSNPWGDGDHFCESKTSGCRDRLNNECIDCTGCDY